MAQSFNKNNCFGANRESTEAGYYIQQKNDLSIDLLLLHHTIQVLMQYFQKLFQNLID